MSKDGKLAELEQEVARLRAQVKTLKSALDPSIPAIAHNLTDNIILLDESGFIRFINWTVPGLTPEEVVGTDLRTYVAEGSRARITSCLLRVRETREPDRFETAYIAQDGEVSLWESRVAPVIDDGKLTGYTVISSNVSERSKAAAERDRFFNLTLDILAIADSTSGHLTRINPAFERVTGFSEQELMAEPYIHFVHPEDRAQTLDAARRLRNGEATVDFENRCLHKSGGYRWISWRGTLDPERHVLYGAGRDVTEQRALEGQARHSQKMAAVGRLAGGIAHDFNNLLLAIRANAELAMKASDAADSRECLDEITLAVDRAAALTAQLLTFSHRQPAHLVAIDLNAVVSALTRLLRRLVPESIELDFLPCADVPRVCADRGQLEQVLVNLCVNARDALTSEGRITISIDTLSLSAGDRHLGSRATPGSFVRLSVTDNGSGMTPEVRERAFEPFFSTKETGKGVGLGLATVYGIVEQHRGAIELSSELGQGTKVDVYFPLTDEPVARSSEPPRALVDRGSGTVLVAEDNDMVRSAVVRMLTNAGYEVLVARDGREAIDIFNENADRIALAVLDVIMPKCGGIEVRARILEKRPELPILVTSGYNELEELRGTSGNGPQVLQKPYTEAALLGAVRRTLDEKKT